MSEISTEVGKRIRTFRKMRHMTLEELAAAVCKSKSTVSKYEKGEIAVDIETLYELAAALPVRAEQLLLFRPEPDEGASGGSCPAFFQGITRFYSYIYDGRTGRLLRCAFDVMAGTDGGRQNVLLYMNFSDYDSYQDCENTYLGHMEHFDAVTNLDLINQNMPMERASIQILASSLDSATKWGLWNGLSSRPMMPIAMKMLFSRTPLKEDEALLKQLKVSKEDIRFLKLYNMLAVT